MIQKLFRVSQISTELFILLFGTWTIASNLAVALQVPFRHLGLMFLLLFAVSAIILWISGFFRDWKTTDQDGIDTDSTNKRMHFFAFITLVILLVGVVLYTNKPSTDDAHYIRTSVDMVDQPEKPVLLLDALGLFENAPIFITVYKAHGIESLCAQISKLTGWPVIDVFHYLLPVLGMIFSAMVYLLLFRKLFPGKAIAAVIISFILMYLVSLQVFSMNVFTKIHEGKGFLLAAVLPFVVLYGLKASGEPKARNWFLLGLGQVCAIGMNSTAFWLAPVVANLSVIAGSIGQSKKQITRNTGLGILSSAYVVAFGLFIVSGFAMPPFYITRNTDTIGLLELSLNNLFGDGILLYLSLFLVLFSWLFAPNKISRAITIIFPAFLVFVFFNPLFIEFISNNFVSERVYWRVAWIIPLQVFLGTIGISFLYHKKTHWLKYLKLTFVIVLILAFGYHLRGSRKLISTKNFGTTGIPTLKVEPEYYISKQINELLTPRDMLLSPEEISIWISTMHNHPGTLIYRLMIRKKMMRDYLDQLEKKKPEDLQEFRKWANWYPVSDYEYPLNSNLSDKVRKLYKETGIKELEIFLDYEFKLTMKLYVSRKLNDAAAKTNFAEGLDHYRITAVCFAEGASNSHKITQVLELMDFKKTTTIGGYELWKK